MAPRRKPGPNPPTTHSYPIRSIGHDNLVSEPVDTSSTMSTSGEQTSMQDQKLDQILSQLTAIYTDINTLKTRVDEFIENGNLSQHLRGTGYEPLSWATRVRIALDSARGLEYIHEHTVPVYVHRDIKSANILIDKDFRAKVADFGLTKLTEVGSTTFPTRLVGTFGYMPPEYARCGDISPKVDVYAFGVVLYELLSAKEAIVRSTGSTSDIKSLVYLFEEALNMSDPKEALHELVDPSLGGDYPIDSVLKIAYLAKSCTHEEPNMRPTMRSVVVALMALSSKSELRDMDSLSVQGEPRKKSIY